VDRRLPVAVIATLLAACGSEVLTPAERDMYSVEFLLGDERLRDEFDISGGIEIVDADYSGECGVGQFVEARGGERLERTLVVGRDGGAWVPLEVVEGHDWIPGRTGGENECRPLAAG
jgi:hypothetical protein